MALFQSSVIKKELQLLNQTVIDEKWNEFVAHFGNLEVQQKIRGLKEEQYQGEFLDDLFVKVLGYTKPPKPNHNLVTEQKNETNSKKADGAIIVDEKVVGVIELKGTNTTDLEKVKDQAFLYKVNHPECIYVITSNFEKLRFYIENTVDFIEFNLFQLSKKEFSLLYVCLSYENIKNNIPKHLKDESVSKENQITKQLYKDYSDFKRALYNNLVALNPQYDKLLLFKKTQKLLDRFLFIFFAEDRQLVPTNLIRRINLEWEDIVKVKRINVSLYERYKRYFDDLNSGAKVTLPAFGKKTGDAITAQFEIFAYNGGLFAPDDVLDKVSIDDDLLHKHSLLLSDYDFESDVDVNILGHIFENSLNEIDEIKSEIEGQLIDKTKTKRKKDGVFYTPKYITKYIVDNTVGKLCTEKKAELKLVDEDYTNDQKIQTKTKKAHLDKLTDYRAWLLKLTICDPACGSGAFLNQALEFLIAEHRYVDELQAKLMGDSMILSDVETSILENNIYGVDLNDESVEIAKLSLWLRTAQKGRKLNSLNNNIKCGNSLIDDPEVAGDKAFSWEKEFPEVFKEKNKFAFHITTALHDSRTSDRMVKYKARERRFERTKPDPEVFPMTKEEEELIASTVADIVREDKLNIAAFNLCWDHMHILLVCEEEDVPKIMHKIKGRTARACNMLRNKGINPLDVLHKDGSIPFWTQKYGCKPVTTEEHFWNTYNYIENNKVKHDLPKNPKLEKIIFGFVKTYEDCFRTEYKGGFDVIIGNPPYVSHDRIDNKEYLKKKYTSYSPFGDLYIFFYELSLNIINQNGISSLITSNSFLKAEYGKPLRKLIIKETSIEQVINIENTQIFSDATVNTVILTFSKNKGNNLKALIVNSEFNVIDFNDFINKNSYTYLQTDFDELSWNLIKPDVLKTRNRIKGNNKTLEDYNTKIRLGIATGDNNAFIIDEEKKKEFIKLDVKNGEIIKPLLRGRDIDRYNYTFPNLYVLLTKNGIDVENEYPNIYDYLDSCGEGFKRRGAKGQHWTNLRACSFFEDFKEEKIVWIELTDIGRFSFCNDEIYLLNSAYFLIPPKELNSKFLLSILNSKVIKFYLKQIANTSGVGTTRWINNYVKDFPIPKINISEQQDFISKSEYMISFTEDFVEQSQKFQRTIQRKFELEDLPKKLQDWYLLSYADFIKELGKLKIKLTLSQEAEWEDYFINESQKALELKSQIDQTDKEIDRMVYELYGLTEEEIQIVENS
jgi:REP element-mobilizing transposase RayT